MYQSKANFESAHLWDINMEVLFTSRGSTQTMSSMPDIKGE